MQSRSSSVDAYLAELPPERRAAIETVRDVLRANLDPAIREGVQYGMIGYFIPHEIFPAGYHCDPRQPLNYAGLASQKNYMSLYLMCVYMPGPLQEWFKSAWAKTGKKLDMGKACIRFKKADDLALDVIGEAVRRVSAAKYIEAYEAVRASQNSKASAKKVVVKKAAAKKVVAKKPAAKKAAAKKTVAKKPATKKATKRRPVT